jgi:cobalt-zinc-cadmium efflux system membrane fusion protein
MKNVRIGQVIIGLMLGVALGVGGVWWLEHGHMPWASSENTTRERGEAEDEHGHGSEGHAEHGEGEDEHGHEEGSLVLSEKAIRESGIEVTAASGGELEQTLTLPGEIVLNADKVAHIVPRVAGIVRRVDKNLGDDVQAGEVMAILESRELAEAKAAYLAAQQRLALAEANLKGAEELHTKKIMPDLEFLAIQKAKAEAEIEFNSAENKLHALGVAEEQLEEMPNHADSLAMYELRAPFVGTVVEKHCSLGEVLSGEIDAFVLADLSTVWAKIAVYTQDMGRVRMGQAVQIRADGVETTAEGTVCYLAPVANEATRTVYARVDLPNPQREWRPGTFVTATLVLNRQPVPVLVPIDALQRLKNDSVVFVTEGDGFEPRTVTVGRMSGTQAEITGGLKPGERYVAKGAVVLKAELGKREAVHEH